MMSTASLRLYRFNTFSLKELELALLSDSLVLGPIVSEKWNRFIDTSPPVHSSLKVVLVIVVCLKSCDYIIVGVE